MNERTPGRHDLFEYVGEVVIKKERIDGNIHLNNAHYFSICEAQRDLFMKSCGIDKDAIRKNLGLRIVIAGNGNFKFIDEVFEGDKIEIHTSAEVVLAHLQFSQHMIREGVEVFNLQCKIAVIDAGGKSKELPKEEIIDRINQANYPFLRRP